MASSPDRGHGPPLAVAAADAPARTKPSNYPEPFASRMAGRVKRPLGDLFGLKSFGVNLTRLPPGAVSAVHHSHSHQDELVYVIEGEPALCTGGDEVRLGPGIVAEFPAAGPAHHIETRSDRDCLSLEIGDRAGGDAVSSPADDLVAAMGTDGRWRSTRKDGTPYL